MNMSKLNQAIWSIVAEAIEDYYKEGYQKGYKEACQLVLDTLGTVPTIQLESTLEEIIEEYEKIESGEAL